MNEYIILNLCDPDNKGVDLQDKTIVPISRIKRFFIGISETTRMILYPVYPQAEFEKFDVKESPAEIEALVMSSITSSDPFNNEQVRRAFLSKYWDAKTEAYKKLDEKNAKLQEDIEKLKEKNATLKDALSDTQKQLEIMVKYSKDKFHSGEHSNEENAKLKDELYSLTFATIRTGMFADLDWGQLSERLQHSNPANPCCRETYKKLTESLFTVSRDDRLDLVNWNNSFSAAIQENKNE